MGFARHPTVQVFGIFLCLIASAASASPPDSAAPSQQLEHIKLIKNDEAMLAHAQAFLDKTSFAALAEVHKTQQYVAAKGQLDSASAARDRDKATGDRQKWLADGAAFHAAMAKVKQIEDPVLNADPFYAPARQQLDLLSTADRYAISDKDGPPSPGDSEAHLRAKMAQLDPSFLAFVNGISQGRVNLLRPNQLTLDSVGLFDLSSGGGLAHVVSVTPPAKALVSIGGVYVRLANFRCSASMENTDIELPGVFQVIEQVHLMPKFHQPLAYLAARLDEPDISEMADIIHADGTARLAKAATERHAPEAVYVKAFGSIEGLLASVPAHLLIGDRSQLGTVRQSLRDQWLSQHAPGGIVGADTILDGVSSDGSFSAEASVNDAGASQGYRVFGKLSSAGLQSLIDAHGGDHVHFRGLIVGFSSGTIQIKDATAALFTPAQTIAVGGAHSATIRPLTGYGSSYSRH